MLPSVSARPAPVRASAYGIGRRLPSANMVASRFRSCLAFHTSSVPSATPPVTPVDAIALYMTSTAGGRRYDAARRNFEPSFEPATPNLQPAPITY